MANRLSTCFLENRIVTVWTSAPYCCRIVESIADSDTPGGRLRSLRESRSGLTQGDVARRCRPPSTVNEISKLERNRLQFKPDLFESIAPAFEMEAADFAAYIVGGKLPKSSIPLVGYVGAGDLYSWRPESGPWVGFDWVDPPPGAAAGCVAVIVRGDSMGDVYMDGDTLYFYKTDDFVEARCLGKDCVVQVRGGSAYIKRVNPGTKRGRYNLKSHGDHPLIEDVEIEWAAPVKHVTKR